MDVTFPVAKPSDDNADKDEKKTDNLAAGIILLYSIFRKLLINGVNAGKRDQIIKKLFF
jgi:hypothetical protein